MGIIKILPKNIVDKIAAGEVVVNASSVIKELVENSIDAGSKNVFVLTKEGGKKIIRVIDDGCGIFRNDIPLAFTRNATSKIYNDVSGISSLGFRGEALSSICYVSNITIMTRNASENIGTKCEIIGNEIRSCSDIAFNVGTTIEVTDLFYNFPARLKHLGSDSSETKEIINITGKLALSHPDVSITLMCDDRNIFSTTGNSDKAACVSSVLGRKKASGLMPIHFENKPLYVEGFVSSPNFINAKSPERVVILNGRYIISDVISKAVDSVFSEFYGKTGADYVLYISLPYNMIDVNIHPAKTTVRFLNESLIMLLIKQGIRDFLRDNFIIKEQVPNFAKPKDKAAENLVFESEEIYDPAKLYSINKNNDEATQNDGNIYAHKTALDETHVDEPTLNAVSEKTLPIESQKEPAQITRSINKEIFLSLTKMKYLGNAFGLYALIECGNELYSIDTHAAHERVLYEKYMKAYQSSSIATQELLVPVVITFSPSEYASVLENLEAFSEIGFVLEDFSDNSVIVRSIPYYLAHCDIESKLSDMAEEIESYSYKASDLKKRNEILIKNACHNAVRGAENLSKEEVFALLKDLYECDIPFTCPHGRPTIGKVSEKYFMKVFERIK